MTPNELGPAMGKIKYESRPVWAKPVMRLLQWLQLPLWRKQQRQWALEGIEVREKGIVLLKENSNGRQSANASAGQENSIAYKAIRKVWFERFSSGNETAGNTSARIDIIAQNLDVIFTLTIHDRPEDDQDIRLLSQLYEHWRKATWKHYQVVAAVVEHEGRYLCMQKPQTRYAYTSWHWEFPGGKVEKGETEVEAICRELREEMDYEVTPVRHLTTVEHSYPDFSLSLSCWLCKAETTEFVRKEHADHRWLLPSELEQLEWCAADAPVIELLKDLKND